MNTQWMKSFVAGLVLTCVSVPLFAQDNAGLVAVLDVAKVFKENPTFESKMQSIKEEANKLKAQIQSEQEALQQEAMGLQSYEIGSAERNNLEGTLEQKQASLRTRARQSEQQLLNREAKIYFDTYSDMQKVVESVAKKFGISIVLRFDSAPIDATNRAEVIKGVNRAVVYHHRLDLTPHVIREMNPAQAQAPGQTTKK